jgi:hypothetical protein
MKLSWKTAFLIAVPVLAWLVVIGWFVIMNQSTTIDIQKKKSAELEGDLKALAEVLPGKATKADLARHQYQRLSFLYNEGDTLVDVRYQWDKFKP